MTETKKTKKETKPKTSKKREEIVLDAKGKILGRLATEAAYYLQEKHSPAFRPNIDEGTVVRVKNARKIKVTGNKSSDKIYWSYSGYPGGIYGRTFEEVFEKYPDRVIRSAVKGMLPKNRMQKPRLKRLIIEE
ncbi:MAG: 50S ribosomal protein L13 [Candidatus Spechtbacterales bacterium]